MKWNWFICEENFYFFNLWLTLFSSCFPTGLNFLTRNFFFFQTHKKRVFLLLRKKNQRFSSSPRPHRFCLATQVQVLICFKRRATYMCLLRYVIYWQQILSTTWWWPKEDVVDFGCYFATHLSQTQMHIYIIIIYTY